MRILMLSHSPNNPNGGASRIFHMLGEALRRRGHEVMLLHEEDMGLPSWRPGRLATTRLFMPRALSKAGRSHHPEDFDVVFSASGMAYPLFRSLQGTRPRPALVNLVHGLAVYDHVAYSAESTLGHWRTSLPYRLVSGPIPGRWDRRGILAADRTVVQNLRDLSEARDVRGDDAAVTMIPAAVHPELLEASAVVRPPADRDAGRLLWFGTWESRKGTHHLPRALREIRRQHPEARLTLGGTGRSPEDLRREFAPEDREAIEVLPRISVAEQAEVFQSSSIFLFPSISEGFGLALLEAMCFGLAAVTTHTGFGADYLHDGIDARLTYPSGDHLARAVLGLLDDDALRAGIAETGRTLARSFTVDRMAERYEAVFLDAIARATP